MRRLLLRPVRLWQRNQNLLLVLAAFGTMAGLAAVSGHWLFYRAAYIIGGLVPLSFLWARLHLQGLEVSVRRGADRLQVGQQINTRMRVVSHSVLPKLLLEVAEQTDMPGGTARTVITLPAHSVRNWKVSTPCRRRGIFTQGPVRVTTGDPFGLFRFARNHGEGQTLIVLPRPEELPYFWAPPAQLVGEGPLRRRTHYVTPNAASVREYQPGDSYNRIHWPTTARLNRLMVKTFEMDPTSNVWLLLDLQSAAHAGQGDESSEEYAVRVVASLANHFLQSNRMVGLLAYGREKTTLEPARGAQQYNRILEALAMARAEGTTPLAQVLQEEEGRFKRHSTVIVVTPSADEDWVRALQALAQHGARAAVVLLESGSFGAGQSSLVPFSTLVASGILTYLVRRGDDLSLALGPTGAAGEPTPNPRQAQVR